MTKTMEHLLWSDLGLVSCVDRFSEIAEAVRAHSLCDEETEEAMHEIYRNTLSLFTKINNLHGKMAENGLIKN